MDMMTRRLGPSENHAAIRILTCRSVKLNWCNSCPSLVIMLNGSPWSKCPGRSSVCPCCWRRSRTAWRPTIPTTTACCAWPMTSGRPSRTIRPRTTPGFASSCARRSTTPPEVLLEGQAIPQTLHAEVAEQHEILQPDLVLKDPASGKARLLIQTYPAART